MKEKIQNIYSLTPLQEGILYELEMNHSQTENLYVSQIQIKIIGELDTAIFLQAFKKVVKRHEALRTKIFSKNIDNNVQVVFHSIDYQPEILDLSNLNKDQQLDEIEKISLKSKKMNVNNSNLMALQLLKLKENQYMMIWTHHHIILDGWSTSIVLDEVFEIYNQLLGKGTKGVVDRPKQFSDFIKHINASNKEDSNQFWKELIKDIEEPTVTFPAKQKNKISEGTHLFWEIEREESQRLREFAAENHVTMNVLVQLVWSLVLKQISNKHKIVYGTVSSGRTNHLIRAEEIVGLLINTVPVVIEIKETHQISDLLKNLHKTLNGILEHSQNSLVDIKNYTNLGKDNSLFETLFVYENYPEATSQGYGIQWEVQNGSESHNFPISLQVQDSKETIKFKLFYNENFMDTDYAEAIKRTFQLIATQIIDVQFVEDLYVKEDFPFMNSIQENHNIIENKKSNSFVNHELRKIWIEFFDREEINAESDFFQLGGHSILAMKSLALHK